MKEEKNMRMKKALKAMLAATGKAVLFTVSEAERLFLETWLSVQPEARTLQHSPEK